MNVSALKKMKFIIHKIMVDLSAREIVISKGWDRDERRKLVETVEERVENLSGEVRKEALTALEGTLRFILSDGVDSESLERQRRDLAVILQRYVGIIIIPSTVPLYRRPLY